MGSPEIALKNLSSEQNLNPRYMKTKLFHIFSQSTKLPKLLVFEYLKSSEMLFLSDC